MPEKHQEGRWSDEKLEKFYQEFQMHLADEEHEKHQQGEMHAALFQLENTDTNTPAGLVQLCARMSKDIRDMKIAADRQKTFIGGVMFAFTAMGFIFTDTFHKVWGFIKGL